GARQPRICWCWGRGDVITCRFQMANLVVLVGRNRYFGPGLFAGLLFLAATAFSQTSGVYREVYLNITGSTVADLTNNAKFPSSPDQTDYLTTSFEMPINTADNYGTRCRALVTAPVTGNYVFWISSDDASTLFLSTDESPATKVTIASVAS